MIASRGRVITDRPELYLRQLCEHFAHAEHRHSAQEFEVRFSDREGCINFAPIVDGMCRLNARQEDELLLDASGRDHQALERLKRIVGKHVRRIGQSEGLTVEWTPATDQKASTDLP